MVRNLCYLDAANEIFFVGQFSVDCHAEFGPACYALSLRGIQVRWKPSLLSMGCYGRRHLTLRKKKKKKTPKASINVSCLPRQAKFRRYDLPYRPCCSSCQVRLKSNWPGNIRYLLFCWCLQRTCPVANKRSSFFKTIKNVNKHFFLERKQSIKDITLSESDIWSLLVLLESIPQNTPWKG